MEFPRAAVNIVGQFAAVQLPKMHKLCFKKSGEEWVLCDPVQSEFGVVHTNNGSSTNYVLKESSDYLYLMDPIQERVYIFETFPTPGLAIRGRLIRLQDRNGNQLIYAYAGADDEQATRIEDGLGRSLDLAYNDDLVESVTDQGGRQVLFTYDFSAADNDLNTTLRSVTDPLGQTTTFRYSGGLQLQNQIASVERPQGNIPYTQTYEDRDLNGREITRVTSQQDALGNTTTLAYDANSNTVTVTRPDSATEVYEHYGHHSRPEAMTDAAGNTANFQKNDDEQMTAITDRLGDLTGFSYHPESGKLASVTNARGDTSSFTYTSQEQTFTFYNLTRVDYPDGTSEEFAYDARGNSTAFTDLAGNTSMFTYNQRGQVLSVTHPVSSNGGAGTVPTDNGGPPGVTTFTYNSDATLASGTDSDTGLTTYSYDAFKRPTQITHPDSSTTQIAYDLNDQITSISDENGQTTTFTYDGNGNVTKVTDAAGEDTEFTYDALDRIIDRTDRLGNTSTAAYDALGRVISLTDRSGVLTQFGYDLRNFLTGITRDEKTLQIDYDKEGVPSSTTTPLGLTSQQQTDSLGFLSASTNPLDQTTSLTRDALNRPTAITDPLDRSTNYGYEARGLLSSVTAPVIGAATYEYDELGRLRKISDLNDQNWTFTQTPMGRTASLTDPLGNMWQYSYDSRGRRMETTYPDAVTLTRSYDGAGNLTGRAYSDGGLDSYSYDALNRITDGDGILFTYDVEGRAINTENPGNNFGATYDEAGRLKTLTYNNGAFTVTYDYDPDSGLLTKVSDSLTATEITFSYDEDFRPVGTQRPSGVDTTLTWDAASRLVRMQDGTILDLGYTYDAAGQMTEVEMTAPLDPADFLAAGVETFTYDAASQLTTTGYEYDARGRLTKAPGQSYGWDGASRLVGIDGTTLAYNGLDDLVTRSQSPGGLHYYYNDALLLGPIVAEQDEDSDEFLRYYVWTPGGRLLYMIDAQNGNKVYFYHFDRTGSTLALTDASGTVTDTYAYSPYGQRLQHTGTNPQPFTHSGRWGVRQEGDSGTLYHAGPLLRCHSGALSLPRPDLAADR